MVEKGSSKGGNTKSGGNGGNGKAFAKSTKFQGKCDDLKGHIFDCSDSKQADMFVATKKEIAEYVGREYTFGGDARLAVEELEKPTLTKPSDPPANASKTDEKIWEKEIDNYVKKKCYIQQQTHKAYQYPVFLHQGSCEQ